MTDDEVEQMYWAIGNARRNKPVITGGGEPRSAMMAKLLRGGDAPDVAGPAYGDLDTPPMQQPDMEWPPSMAGKPQPARQRPDPGGQAQAPDVGVEGVGLPDVAQLYKQMATVQNEPLDYSGITAANRSQQAGARNDMMTGLVLSTLGGKRLAPAGGAIFKKALDTNPLRPNLADVGYFDDEGNFAENPAVARSAKEKVLAGRIDSLTRMEEKYMQQEMLKAAREQTAELARGRLAQQKLNDEERARHNKAMEGLGRDKANKGGEPKYVPGMQTTTGKPVFRTAEGYTDGHGNPIGESVMTTTGAQVGIGEAAGLGAEDDELTEVSGLLADPANKKAFGPHMGAVSQIPWAEGAYLTPAQGELRARIGAKAGKMRHEISGAAVTLGEQPFLSPYIIDVNKDTVEQVQWKLAGLQKIRMEQLAKLRARGFKVGGKAPPATPVASPAGAASTPLPKAPAGAPQPPPGMRRVQ